MRDAPRTWDHGAEPPALSCNSGYTRFKSDGCPFREIDLLKLRRLACHTPAGSTCCCAGKQASPAPGSIGQTVPEDPVVAGCTNGTLVPIS